MVFPWGVEPQSSEPESEILSIELWEHLVFMNAKLVIFSVIEHTGSIFFVAEAKINSH